MNGIFHFIQCLACDFHSKQLWFKIDVYIITELASVICMQDGWHVNRIEKLKFFTPNNDFENHNHPIRKQIIHNLLLTMLQK